MNFKQFAVGAALAASVAGVVTAAPADAFTLNFTGTARLKNANVVAPGTSVLDFAAFNNGINSTTVGTGTGKIADPTDPLFGNAGDAITLKDLKLTKTGANTWQLASVSDGVDFISGLLGGATYSLQSFVLTRVGNTFQADYFGLFSNLSDPGVGEFTAQGQSFIQRKGSAFSSTVTVPTPALLPGLAGMALATLRKRKQKEVEQPETVNA